MSNCLNVYKHISSSPTLRTQGPPTTSASPIRIGGILNLVKTTIPDFMFISKKKRVSTVPFKEGTIVILHSGEAKAWKTKDVIQ